MKKLNTLLLISLLLFTSCSKSSPSKTSFPTIASDNLIELLSKNKIAGDLGSLTLDSTYSLPTKDWVVNDFAPKYMDFIKQMKISDYTTEENDCDNFSLAAKFYANVLHHQEKSMAKHTGIAFGEFGYTQSMNGSNHAIDIILTQETNKTNIVILFFEPQTGQLVNLTQKEYESCFYYIF